ncbi:MAG: threonine--tRNA ligase [bacterium]
MPKDINSDLETLRHSASHIMAQAVLRLYPGTKLGIGPAIDDGFYYDFDFREPITTEDLPKIEAEMKRIIKEDLPFERVEMKKAAAIKYFEKHHEKFKVELIKDIPDDTVSFYKNKDFTDLCRGPHITSTGELKAFKLLTVAGAYWRGSEHNPQLTRIYGTAFNDQKDLDSHVTNLEEAIKRDHRKLGPQLDLFNIFHDEAGAGFVYYFPKGTTLRYTIETFLREQHLKRGYEAVTIPHLASINLFKTSGHTEYYSENMYFLDIDKQKYVVKPMNCPGHILIFKRKKRSYRDLPIRYFELGTVYRYERSGVLHGLLRVRGFTQDDAHIFCRADQLQDEISKVMDFVFDMMKTFGFEYEINLSTRPEKYVGSDANWEAATDALKHALESKEQKYEIDPGAGVFYGPKIDIKLKDALGRLWQGPTIQVDFNLPERFDLKYTGTDNKEHRLVMIHRVVLGSMERFIGALVEHYAGEFPLWLAPVQAVILPIAERHHSYALSVKEKLMDKGIRVEIDSRNEKIGYKIREAEMQKIPYMLVMGDKEIDKNAVSVRSKKAGDLGSKDIASLIKELTEGINKKGA